MLLLFEYEDLNDLEQAQEINLLDIISKYSMPFCLIPEIIHPSWLIFNDAKRNWILHYRGWKILILNTKRHGIFVLSHAANTKQDLERWRLTKHNKFRSQHKWLLIAYLLIELFTLIILVFISLCFCSKKKEKIINSVKIKKKTWKLNFLH